MTCLFFVGLSLFIVHELDAMTAEEWRIIPGINRLEDALGRQLFVVGHIPLLVVVFWGISGPEQQAWIFALNIFMVAHMVAHILFHKHPANGFRRKLSWILIGGAAVVGGIDLVIGLT